MMRAYAANAGGLVMRAPSTLGSVSEDAAAGLDGTWSSVDAALGDPLFTAIHELAQRIGRLQQQVNAQLANVANADADFDADLFVGRVQQLAGWHAQLADLIAQFRNSPEYVADARTAAMLQNWGVLSANWARSVMIAVGGALADFPEYVLDAARDALNAVADAATDVGAHTGWSLLKVLAPVAVIGALLLYGTREAESTRTYKRYVA